MSRYFDLLIINEKTLKKMCENMFAAFFQNTLHYTTRKTKIQQKKPQKECCLKGFIWNLWKIYLHLNEFQKLLNFFSLHLIGMMLN